MQIRESMYSNTPINAFAHCGVENRTPHEAFLAFTAVLKNEALTV
jgi:hypothetical protein